MKYKFWLIGIGLILAGFGVWRYLPRIERTVFSPRGEVTKQLEKPYTKYSFSRLAERGGRPGKIEIGRQIASGEGYEARMFYYHSEGRRISGMLTWPIGPESNTKPVVVMARGYVDKETYQTGVGTKNAAIYYALHGYIVLAPDFLGYGESDPEDENALGARLTKPVEILDLLATVTNIAQADGSRVFLWGHSNGGQIMLSVAEILRGDSSKSGVRGATLWAPVSKPFPYSILYYTDEADDQGKWLRAEVAKFESEYDVYNYSIDKYLDWIDLPIQIHQGSADESVPKKWTDEIVTRLKGQDKSVNYYLYPGADHNLKPGWDTVVERDIEWFEKLAENQE